MILASHLGRPGGERRPELSLAPVAPVLAAKLQRPVLFLEDCVGEEVKAAVSELADGDVALLENLRFNPGERANDDAFVDQLAELADAYVNDAFGTAHRAHASTYGVARRLPIRVSGYVIARELKYLGDKTAQPERPFVVILGGAKVSDKIQVIDALLDKADTLIVGGAMAYTFALAQGKTIGDSQIGQQFRLLVVGIKQVDGPIRFNPQAQHVLEVNDVLIVLGQLGDIESFRGGQVA